MSPKCGASRLFNQEAYCSGTAGKFFIEGNFLLPVNCGSHSDYQTLLLKIFANIIRMLQLPSLLPLGRSLISFGILICHQLMILCKTAILSLVLNHGSLPTCFALSLFLLNLKLLPTQDLFTLY